MLNWFLLIDLLDNNKIVFEIYLKFVLKGCENIWRKIMLINRNLEERRYERYIEIVYL